MAHPDPQVFDMPPARRSVRAFGDTTGAAFPEGVGELAIVVRPEDLADPVRRQRLHEWIDLLASRVSE